MCQQRPVLLPLRRRLLRQHLLLLLLFSDSCVLSRLQRHLHRKPRRDVHLVHDHVHPRRHRHRLRLPAAMQQRCPLPLGGVWLAVHLKAAEHALRQDARCLRLHQGLSRQRPRPSRRRHRLPHFLLLRVLHRLVCFGLHLASRHSRSLASTDETLSHLLVAARVHERLLGHFGVVSAPRQRAVLAIFVVALHRDLLASYRVHLLHRFVIDAVVSATHHLRRQLHCLDRLVLLRRRRLHRRRCRHHRRRRRCRHRRRHQQHLLSPPPPSSLCHGHLLLPPDDHHHHRQHRHRHRHARLAASASLAPSLSPSPSGRPAT